MPRGAGACGPRPSAGAFGRFDPLGHADGPRTDSQALQQLGERRRLLALQNTAELKEAIHTREVTRRADKRKQLSQERKLVAVAEWPVERLPVTAVPWAVAPNHAPDEGVPPRAGRRGGRREAAPRAVGLDAAEGAWGGSGGIHGLRDGQGATVSVEAAAAAHYREFDRQTAQLEGDWNDAVSDISALLDGMDDIESWLADDETVTVSTATTTRTATKPDGTSEQNRQAQVPVMDSRGRHAHSDTLGLLYHSTEAPVQGRITPTAGDPRWVHASLPSILARASRFCRRMRYARD
jgi:hypothetical protein